MPVLTLPLTAQGEAVVQVTVGVTKARALLLRSAGQPVPAPVAVPALLDTGAAFTCIDPTVRQALGLVPSVAHTAFTVGARRGQRVNYYRASLTVVHPSGDVQLNLSIPLLDVTEVHLALTGHSVLIGCDVLAGCEFHYGGRNRVFALSY
jgi:hypothetical protein